MHELHTHIETPLALLPAVIDDAGDVVGPIIDLQDALALELVVSIGTAGVTFDDNTGFDVVLEHSEATADEDFEPLEDSKFLLGAGVVGGVVLALREGHDEEVYRFGYKRDRRYVRVRVVPVGVHAAGTVIGATAVVLPKVRPSGDQVPV